MDNITRALVMAGGILIGILILGALMLMFNSIGAYQTNKNNSEILTEIAQFNNQFEPYNKDNLTLMELKSVYNKILGNRKSSEFKIDSNLLDETKAKAILNCSDTDRDGKKESIYNDFINNFNSIIESQKIYRRFKCKSIEYANSGGRISQIDFEDNTK